MKHIAALLLACVMLAAAGLSLAETKLIELPVSNADISYANDMLIIRNNKQTYLADTTGAKVGMAYDSISQHSSTGLYTVKALNNSLQREGVIDAMGQVLVPAQYMDTEIVSDRWALGITVKASTEESSDYTVTNYSTGNKSFYLIDQVDVYYRGTKVGTIARTDYQYAYAHGDYIFFRDRSNSNAYSCYNKDFQPSPSRPTSSSEYESNYKNGSYTYYHQGSGQMAFVPGCTLTPDEVDRCYMISKGNVYDLQGNVISTLKQNYDSVPSTLGGRYAKVRLYDKYGYIDVTTGEEIIPLQYDELDDYWYDTETGVGYVCAVKDGKVGFVKNGGEVTCDFIYADSAVGYHKYGLFAWLGDPAGGIIVLSAQAGVLPERYEEADFRDGARAFVAKRSDGTSAIIGLNGQELVPFNDARYMYVNNDATVATGYVGSSQYRVWTMDYEDAVAGEEEPAPVEEPAPADNGTWTCSNGHEGNTGKFCPECGEKKPVVCPGCGAVYPAAEAPKFCPECGTNLQ